MENNNMRFSAEYFTECYPKNFKVSFFVPRNEITDQAAWIEKSMRICTQDGGFVLHTPYKREINLAVNLLK